jgi:hypothetical protein
VLLRQRSEDVWRPTVLLLHEDHLVLSFTGADPGYVPRYGVELTQAGPDLLDVKWGRTSFRPVLLDRPDVRGSAGVLYTFVGEEGQNHVLAWPTGADAVQLQLMGPAEPAELVHLARDLQTLGRDRWDRVLRDC